MCVDARYPIHFSFHRFCDESSRGFAISGSGVKLLPPVVAAHAGNIESIVAQITLTMCLLCSQKKV